MKFISVRRAVVYITPVIVTTDALARATIKQSEHHTGYHSCNGYIIRGSCISNYLFFSVMHQGKEVVASFILQKSKIVTRIQFGRLSGQVYPCELGSKPFWSGKVVCITNSPNEVILYNIRLLWLVTLSVRPFTTLNPNIRKIFPLTRQCCHT